MLFWDGRPARGNITSARSRRRLLWGCPVCGHAADLNYTSLILQNAVLARRVYSFQGVAIAALRIKPSPTCLCGCMVAGAPQENGGAGELFRVPAHAAWFHYNAIHGVERDALPDFFLNTSAAKNSTVHLTRLQLLTSYPSYGGCHPCITFENLQSSCICFAKPQILGTVLWKKNM